MRPARTGFGAKLPAVLPTVLPALVSALLLAACAAPPPPPPRPVDYVVLLPDLDGRVGQVSIRGAKGEQRITEAGSGAALDGTQAPAPVPPEQLQRDFGAAEQARPEAPEHFYLYFESGGAQLTAESEAQIPTILARVAARNRADVSVIGHTDTKGSAASNALLDGQRAQTIAKLLRERGMQAASVEVESHGKADLLVQTPDETAEPRNRRVEVTVR